MSLVHLVERAYKRWGQREAVSDGRLELHHRSDIDTSASSRCEAPVIAQNPTGCGIIETSSIVAGSDGAWANGIVVGGLETGECVAANTRAIRASDDSREGTQAFLEKDSPRWKGH